MNGCFDVFRRNIHFSAYHRLSKLTFSEKIKCFFSETVRCDVDIYLRSQAMCHTETLNTVFFIRT